MRKTHKQFIEEVKEIVRKPTLAERTHESLKEEKLDIQNESNRRSMNKNGCY